jgi:hypothetical protein
MLNITVAERWDEGWTCSSKAIDTDYNSEKWVLTTPREPSDTAATP